VQCTRSRPHFKMNFISPKQRQQWLSRAEDYADTFLQRTKNILPHLARLCLIATFLEDGLRMWIQWSEQRKFIMNTWRTGPFVGDLFVLINLCGQLIPCGMILTRKKTDLACALLVFIIAIQSVIYGIFLLPYFFLRSCSLVGGLLLLMVENRKEVKSLFAGVPTLNKNNPKNYMQLTGRLLLVIMFITIVRLEPTIFSILQNLIGGILILFVAVGFKTKLSALVLVIFLTLANFYANCFWRYGEHKILHDFLKYDFFQTISVVGGLLYIVALGAGSVSVDGRKKNW